MLQLQEYLRAGNATETLTENRGINVYRHPTLPLVGFKYSQIDSPKTDQIVRECRGTVLEDGTWDLVAKPFFRFFNAGEVIEEFQTFNWSDFSCSCKEDGSLQILYHYAGEWHVNTSGSFGLGEVPYSGRSWRELFWETATFTADNLDPSLTYILELCTAWNKVVRRYSEPKVFLLSAFRGEQELTVAEVDCLANDLPADVAPRYDFHSRDEVLDFLSTKEEQDPTFEGVIVRCKRPGGGEDLRFKWKTKTYLSLHRLKGNNNIFNPKHLLPFILAGEGDELLCYFPEVKPIYEKTKEIVDQDFNDLVSLWERYHSIENQKEFALSIAGRPYTGLLFRLRQEFGQNQTRKNLEDSWRNSHDLIAKRRF